MKHVCISLLIALSLASGVAVQGQVQAELRSSTAILPPGTPGGAATGAQPWVCDAAQGFAPVVDIEPGLANSMLAIATTGGVKLPISPTTVPATCGQVAVQSSGTVYITQAVVDTKNTPSTARGILRTVLDPVSGALVGPSAYIATTAGLDGSQPTAAAIGPDGNLYVAFLKSGNIKRILG